MAFLIQLLHIYMSIHTIWLPATLEWKRLLGASRVHCKCTRRKEKKGEEGGRKENKPNWRRRRLGSWGTTQTPKRTGPTGKKGTRNGGEKIWIRVKKEWSRVSIWVLNVCTRCWTQDARRLGGIYTATCSRVSPKPGPEEAVYDM